MKPDTKYTCQFGTLTLSVRECAAGKFKARVVGRKPADVFKHALVIRPGTVLTLRKGKTETRYIRVQAFAPKLQYGGRLVASGVITAS